MNFGFAVIHVASKSRWHQPATRYPKRRGQSQVLGSASQVPLKRHLFLRTTSLSVKHHSWLTMVSFTTPFCVKHQFLQTTSLYDIIFHIQTVLYTTWFCLQFNNIIFETTQSFIRHHFFETSQQRKFPLKNK